MGRPRTFDTDAAIEVALEAFRRHGYDNVSVANLSTAIGVGPPSLYAAFGDKRGLYEQAVGLYSKRLDDGLDRALAHPVARTAMHALLTDSLTHFTPDTGPKGCLVLRDRELSERRDLTRRKVRDRLRRAVDDGELASIAEADAFATFVDSVLTGLAGQAVDGRPREDLEDTVVLAMRAWPGRGQESAP